MLRNEVLIETGRVYPTLTGRVRYNRECGKGPLIRSLKGDVLSWDRSGRNKQSSNSRGYLQYKLLHRLHYNINCDDSCPFLVRSLSSKLRNILLDTSRQKGVNWCQIWWRKWPNIWSKFSSFSSVGSTTLVGFGLLNCRWAFSAGRFHRVPLPAARQTPNLEENMV
jgi:hypothetical protein